MKIRYIFLGLLSFMMVLSTQTAIARDSSDGCGLGWEVNDDKSFMGTTTRGTTHSILIPTFSMTFGTSGCDEHSIVKNEFKGIHYTEANYANLMVEMPMGSGEFLTGYSQVLGCTAVDETFKAVMQHNYEAIYPSNDTPPTQVYQNVLSQIESNVVLSTNCSRL